MSQSDTSCLEKLFKPKPNTYQKYIDMHASPHGSQPCFLDLNRLESSMNGRLASIEASLLEFSHGYATSTHCIHRAQTRTASLASTGVSLLRLLPSGPTTIVLLRLCERRLGVLASSRVPAAAAAPVADHDTCEVRVSGIPLSVDRNQQCDSRGASSLPWSWIGCVHTYYQLREWAPRRLTPVAAPSTSNAVLDLEMKTMVIRFSSANARETFLAAAPKFQRLSTHAFLASQTTDVRIILEPTSFLPSDRHRLYRRLRSGGAEAHGYPRPFVRNLCIYMRRAARFSPNMYHE
ncbi:unnamed protein product [Trichogramma brassicae]|uniref:Uncharacterized protein n=1 Tax=Trichogramma brassicae TaxID=86971 RepID=A0A6H5HVU4_9HYME|nr:unnamed protein product [Trichogramma brassicae]